MALIFKKKTHFLTRLPIVLMVILIIGFSPVIPYLIFGGSSGGCNESNCIWAVLPWLMLYTLPFMIMLLIIMVILVFNDVYSMKKKKQIYDKEIFNDAAISNSSNTNKSSSRKLFRDTGNGYIGGVSSGLAYYFGLNSLWIRIFWVFLFFGLGTGILLYMLLWILMPAAKTTVDKLAVSGKPINISNMDKKVKEGSSTDNNV